MSNIYIQEPPTTGKVMMKTSIGDIDIELWTKEAPKACRNFIKLCYDNYYNNTIFHRIVKDFIVQGGDPLGTGEGGESIYGRPFKDEFHSRLRFCRRGLVAMANAGKDDNGSQFFFTLSATPELQNKHTIFGKVTGETLYNVLKFEECLIDKDDRPVYPPKILKTQVLTNPFEDIVPSETTKEIDEEKEREKEKRKKKKKGVKDFKLLSFGEEAEEDEEEFKELNKKFSGKSKSAHDVLDDPKLSSEPALEQASSSSKKRKNSDSDDESNEETPEDLQKRREMSERVIEKLKSGKKATSSKKIKSVDEEENEEEDDEDKYYLGKDHADERKRMAESIKKEIRDLKRGIQKTKKSEEEAAKKEKEAAEREKEINSEKEEREEIKKKLREQQKKNKAERNDDFIMQKLNKFRNKIHAMKEQCGVDSEKSEAKPTNDNDDEVIDETILAHSLHCEDKNPVLARDANLKDDDWFEIYDPRNPINKRRRGETTRKGENSDRGKNRPPRT
ncbi:spliceosome-associated protein CWC27 homolog [Leptopilina heterotoma]|uniref:spliceosome-associated protein CWC27 homolog n=1 Tax=Leptopilina heterotoma TaxID=63436 RepID=UPI001CA7C307|nr:spliceosome-associated protein CWC27 homolog [Leptopilina heterotoma]XP_043477196.1 spliceosome-associated protein CWC27 homolog [Leptopilina heterotoma]XP_043477197.1 spliceosome-associated protein CWC27 homolog [Leptopilina heterotoma]